MVLKLLSKRLSAGSLVSQGLKKMKNKKSGSGTEDMKKWPYFSALSFIVPSLQAARTQSSLIRHPAQTAPAAAAPAPAPVPLQKQPPKLTTLPNGVVLASVENITPVSRIAVMYKAGSRYETHKNMGITHALRNCAGLGTKDASIVGITRNLQQIGASLSTTASREHMIYKLDCSRDDLDIGIQFLAQVATEQVFKHWEVEDFLPRLKAELALMQTQPQVQLMELLHKVAFRGNLRNSLYCPQYMVGKHNPEMLSEYVNNNFTPKRMAIVGVGIPHEVLEDFSEIFQVGQGTSQPELPPAYGGGEARLEMGLPYTHVAVAAEGVSTKNQKEVIASAILQQVMGINAFIKRGTSPGKLAQAAHKVTQDPFAVSCININYSDSGLIGFYLVGQPDDMDGLVKAVVSEFKSIVQSGVPDMDFQVAKDRVKAIIHMDNEDNGTILEDMGLQAFSYGKLLTDSELDQLIDSVTAADVNHIAKKVLGGRPTMAAIGQLHKTPYLDELF